MNLKHLHDGLRQSFPTALWRGSPARREIALTFDDGPDAKSTSKLLTLLDHYQARATFFQIGQRAEAAPHLVRQVMDAGHQIGLHGYGHQSFLLKGSVALCQELAETQRVLVDACGYDAALFNAVRPPFGHFTSATLATLLGAGYLPVMWSLVPFHWLQSAAKTVRQVMGGVNNGTILVLHEGLPGPAVVDLTMAILPHLVADGYRFVTINEMWANVRQDRL